MPHFAAAGETLPCSSCQVHAGVKGLNQSIALAAVGAKVRHVGKVGEDGRWLLDLMSIKNIDVGMLKVDPGPTEHANIQVRHEGENSIVLFRGAKRTITKSHTDEVLEATRPGEFLLLSNAISSLDYLVGKAREKEIRVLFNAVPMSEDVNALPLEAIELLVINN